MRQATLALAELLTAAGRLEPPPVLWRVMKTGEIFFDRTEATEAARTASVPAPSGTSASSSNGS